MQDYIKSKEFDGYSRKLYLKTCPQCLTDFRAPAHTKAFCSATCSTKHRSTLVDVECDFCHIQHKRSPSQLLKSKTGLRFCSRECKDEAQKTGSAFNKTLLPHSLDKEYRKHALRIYGAKCKECSYSATVKMLDVDHIDSNRKNNTIENLQVLCVWCHALKTRKVKTHERI
jgi:hypothetical protein